MKIGRFLVVVALIAACSKKAEGPKREAVLPLLQKEAEQLKADGEKMSSPELGVKSTWTVEAVDVREQPNDETNPWAGTVKVKIVTATKDYDGSQQFDQSERRFEYVWSAALGRWVTKYVPATPPPSKKTS
jgi:hypothetical protein